MIVSEQFLRFYNDIYQRATIAVNKKLEESILEGGVYMNLEELKEKIEEWARSRDLHEAPPEKQMMKVVEELGELSSAIVINDEWETSDALGDVFVTLVILAMQLGFNLTYCVDEAYQEIKDRKGKMIDGTFIKEDDLK